MYNEEFLAVTNAAKFKNQFLKKNPMGFFVSSMMAGMFVGFGVLLIFTIGGLLFEMPYAKIIMGASFGIALSLVVMSGSELFTGNNMIMIAGVLNKKVSFSDTLKLWVVCYLGNWLGSIILAIMFYKAGLATKNVGEFIAISSSLKMNASFTVLFFRGVLCNILVCLATWCSFKCKSESGKLIMIFWCLFAFITSGYEHSIANMTLLTIGLLSPLSADVSIFGYFYNILVVTLGNMVGGILFVAMPYFIISKREEV
jgi:nitrite transporter NirC